MKNGADFRRLHIHSESAMNWKMFLVFLSLIIRLEMSLLICTTIGGKNIIYTERTKL